MFSDVTEVEILNCEIEWKLYDFYKHETFMENGQFLTSKQFYNPKCPSIKWELRIYPNNNPEDPRSLISLVQVGLENSDDSLKAQFYIYTLDNKGEKVFCSLGNTFSFKNQIESDKYELRRRTMPNSPLIIFCEVEFVPYQIKLENEFVDYSTPKNSFMEIFTQGILTDCVFEIGDEKINAHKCILANYSIVFQKMFEQKNMKEAKSGKIKIVDTSPECFKIMLEYFYSGEIDKKTFEKYSEDLFAIAHKYEVKQLMELCENYMAANIDAANFSDRCNYAELYSLLKLEKACFNYFSTNRSTFILSKEWNKFKINNKDFAFRLLEETHDFGEKYDSPTIKKVKEARRFTEIQKRILVQKFSEQRYLNSIDRDDMAIKTGLTGSQVMSWFQQRRAIWKRNTRRINLL